MPLIQLLEYVLVIGILFGIVFAIVRAMPMPSPWPEIAYGVLAIIAVVLLFSWILGVGPAPLHLR